MKPGEGIFHSGRPVRARARAGRENLEQPSLAFTRWLFTNGG